MKTVIIGIHGLGNKPEKAILKKWWRASIIEGLKSMGIKKIKFQFQLAYWADLVHRFPLDPYVLDKNDPAYLDEIYLPRIIDQKIRKKRVFKKLFLDVAEKLINVVFISFWRPSKIYDFEKRLIESNFPDLYIYYNGKSTINGKTYSTQQLIRKRLVKIIKRHKNKKIILIAHSMGSIIAYDVLTKVLCDINIDTFVTIGSPLGMPTLKKFYLKETEKNPQEKREIKTPDNIRSNWFNLSDLNDKVAIYYKIRGDYLINRHKVAPIDKVINNDYEVDKQKNPHKSYGYLRTKEMAEILAGFLGLDKFREIKKAIRRFKSTIKEFFNHKRLG